MTKIKKILNLVGLIPIFQSTQNKNIILRRDDEVIKILFLK